MWVNFQWSGRQDLNLQPLGPKPNALPSWATSRLNGAPNRSRTHNLLIRSQMLYPVELWARLIPVGIAFRNYVVAFVYYNLTKWWLQLESNQRHQDFQSCALPTELWSHLAVPTGLEPAIPRVTGECDNHYTTEPIWLRKMDLNQRPLGYEPNELPGCSIPRFVCSTYLLSYGGGKGIRTPAPISWPPGFQDRSLQPDLGIPPINLSWCPRSDLNRYELLHSQDFKSCASTYSATEAQNNWCLAGDSNPRPLD